MRMYSVRKSFSISVGHRLAKHPGNCKYLHGHNFKVIVQVSSQDLDDNDMVIDFSELKEIVWRVLELFDHNTVLTGDCLSNNQIVSDLTSAGQKVFLLFRSTDPTAEVLSRTIYEMIQEELKCAGYTCSLDFVRIYENEGSMAEYRAS